MNKLYHILKFNTIVFDKKNLKKLQKKKDFLNKSPMIIIEGYFSLLKRGGRCLQDNINGLNDLLFHQIFCGHGGEKLLKPFLEEVLPIEEFKYLKTLNPVLPLERINEKSKIPDSLVQTDKYIINTECNRFYYRYLNRKILLMLVQCIILILTKESIIKICQILFSLI